MSDQSVSSIADSIWRFQSITFEWGFSRCRSDFEGCLGVAATPRHAVSSCYLGAAHKLSMSYCVARRSSASHDYRLEARATSALPPITDIGRRVQVSIWLLPAPWRPPTPKRAPA